MKAYEAHCVFLEKFAPEPTGQKKRTQRFVWRNLSTPEMLYSTRPKPPLRLSLDPHSSSSMIHHHH